MDYNSLNLNLTNLFQRIAITNEITEDFVNDVQNILIEIVDGADVSIFNSALLTNFIYLVENTNSTPVIKHLITELKLKSLRLIYTGVNNVFTEITPAPEEELPKFTDIAQLPPPGQFSHVKHVLRDGDDEITTTYRVDSTGQAVSIVNVSKTKINRDLDRFNDNIIERVLTEIDQHKNTAGLKTPISENDL